MTAANDGVTNPGVRAAVLACAADPTPLLRMDVLRACLNGALLFDVTGSQITINDAGSEMQAGSSIKVAVGTGPDGEPAALAYTSQAEIARVHPEGTKTQSVVQPGPAALEVAQLLEQRWIVIDVAGPSCALSRDEIDFALQVPRNDAVREAVAVVTADPDRRDVLVAALRAEGTLVLAATVGPDGPDGSVLTGALPDGSTGVLVFTSGPEAMASAPNHSLAILTTAEVATMVRGGGFGGVIVNPAGPWAAVPASDLLN